MCLSSKTALPCSALLSRAGALQNTFLLCQLLLNGLACRGSREKETARLGQREGAYIHLLSSLSASTQQLFTQIPAVPSCRSSQNSLQRFLCSYAASLIISPLEAQTPDALYESSVPSLSPFHEASVFSQLQPLLFVPPLL